MPLMKLMDAQLHHALRKEATAEEVKQLLGADPARAAAVKDEDGNLPLHVAAMKQASPEVVKMLIEAHSAATAVADKNGLLPLHLAVLFTASPEVVKLLIEAHPPAAAAATIFGDLPLHLAFRNEASEEVVKLLIEAHPAAVAVANKDGWLPLHRAAANKASEEVVKLLIEANPAAAAAKNEYGFLPLHLAAACEASPEVLQLLIVAHPDAAAEASKDGDLPLHLAAKYKASEEVVNLLLKAYPPAAAAANDDGELPLHRAAAKKASSEVVKLLIEAHPAAAAAAKQDGELPLHLALRNKASPEVQQLLIEARRDAAAAADKDGWLPLHRAAANKASVEVVKLLIEAHRDAAAAATKDGDLPLHLALRNKASPEVQQLLIEARRDAAAAADKDGYLPLHLAVFNKASPDMLTLLLAETPDAAAAIKDIGRLSQMFALLAELDGDTILAELDEDSLGRCLAHAAARGGPTPAVHGTVRLAEQAHRLARKLRSSDPRAADAQHDFFVRLQLGTAALVELNKEKKLLATTEGKHTLDLAVRIHARELLAQPVVQDFVVSKWYGELREVFDIRQGTSAFSRDEAAFYRCLIAVLLPLQLPLLPLLALVPPLQTRFRDKAKNSVGCYDFFFLDIPIFKFGLECAANIGLALLVTVSPTAALGALPESPILLVWVVSGLAWEAQQLGTSGLSLYWEDHFNRLDLLAHLVSLSALIAALATGDEGEGEDAGWAVALHTLAALFLWLRTLRVAVASPELGPFVLMFFNMLFGDIIYFLALLCILLIAFGGAFNVLLGADIEGESWRWFFAASDAGELVPTARPSMLIPYGAEGCAEEFGRTFIPFLLLESALVGGGDFFECARASVPEARFTAWILSVAFCLLTGILLLNMLIAMMAKTFDSISEASSTNYLFLFSQLTLSLADQPPTPPPLYALSLPYEVYKRASGVYNKHKHKLRCCKSSRSGKVADQSSDQKQRTAMAPAEGATAAPAPATASDAGAPAAPSPPASPPEPAVEGELQGSAAPAPASQETDERPTSQETGRLDTQTSDLGGEREAGLGAGMELQSHGSDELVGSSSAPGAGPDPVDHARAACEQDQEDPPAGSVAPAAAAAAAAPAPPPAAPVEPAKQTEKTHQAGEAKEQAPDPKREQIRKDAEAITAIIVERQHDVAQEARWRISFQKQVATVEKRMLALVEAQSTKLENQVAEVQQTVLKRVEELAASLTTLKPAAATTTTEPPASGSCLAEVRMQIAKMNELLEKLEKHGVLAC